MNYYNDFLSPGLFEKKDIRKHANMNGLALLVFFLANIPFSFIIVILFMILKNQNLLEASQGMLDDVYFLMSSNVILSALLLTFPFVLIAKILKYKVRNLISIKLISPLKVFSLTLIAIGFFGVGQFVATLTQYIFSLFHLEPTMPADFSRYTDFKTVAFLILTGAVAPALFEEVAFRGILLNTLRKFGDWPAIIVSALLFGAMHGNFVQIPFAFCAGIGLGICYVKSNSIWPCILAHFINNAISFLMPALSKRLPDVIVTHFDFYVGVLFLALGVFGAVIYHKKFGAGFRLNRVPSTFSSTKRTLLIISSPLVIISVLCFLGLAVVTLLHFDSVQI